MKTITKRTLWMSSAVALALVGCKTTQKHETASMDEDVRFEQEILDSFSRRENVSDWMDFFEKEIKSGEWKLSEKRKANRTLASSVPLIIDLAKQLQKDKGMTDEVLKEANRIGKSRFKTNWKELKSVEELEAYAKYDQNFDVTVTENMHKKIRTEARYQAIRASKGVLDSQSKVAQARKVLATDVKTSKAAAKAGTTASDEADEIVKGLHFQEVKTQGAVTTRVKARIEEYMGARISEVKKLQGVPQAEIDNMVRDLNEIQGIMVKYVDKSGGQLPPLRSKGCQIARGEVDTKNMKEMYQTAFDDMAKWVDENPGKTVCAKVKHRGFKRFQQFKRGRKNEAAEMAVAELNTCGAVDGDSRKIAEANLLSGKTAFVEKVSCP